MSEQQEEGLLKERIHEEAQKNASEIELRFLGVVRVSLKTVDQTVDDCSQEFWEIFSASPSSLMETAEEKIMRVETWAKKWLSGEKNGH